MIFYIFCLSFGPTSGDNPKLRIFCAMVSTKNLLSKIYRYRKDCPNSGFLLSGYGGIRFPGICIMYMHSDRIADYQGIKDFEAAGFLSIISINRELSNTWLSDDISQISGFEIDDPLTHFIKSYNYLVNNLNHDLSSNNHLQIKLRR